MDGGEARGCLFGGPPGFACAGPCVPWVPLGLVGCFFGLLHDCLDILIVIYMLVHMTFVLIW